MVQRCNYVYSKALILRFCVSFVVHSSNDKTRIFGNVLILILTNPDILPEAKVSDGRGHNSDFPNSRELLTDDM